MAITVNLYYKGVNGNARKFMEEMEKSGTADAIRAEKGNLRYNYFFPAQEAIDAHHASPMMTTLAALRDKYDLHMTVERYLSDNSDVDSEFIRK